MYKHHEIYRTLTREILDGQYDAIQRLPSEAQLVRRFGVSRPTVARALRDLQSEGVIERRVGSGSFLKGVQPSTTEASRHLRRTADNTVDDRRATLPGLGQKRAARHVRSPCGPNAPAHRAAV
jgi:DNA-binding GntR family transcriptional regulator